MSDLNQSPIWPALLRWSLQQFDAERPPDSDVKPMEPERRAWLERAMRHLVVDPVERMKVLVASLRVPETASGVNEVESLLRKKQLGGPEDTDDEEEAEAALTLAADGVVPSPEEAKAAKEARAQRRRDAALMSANEVVAAVVHAKERALDELDEHVDKIDYAQDLHRVGGFATVIDLLASPHAGVQWRAAQVIATVVQNNPTSQKWALELGVLDRALRLLELTPMVGGVGSASAAAAAPVAVVGATAAAAAAAAASSSSEEKSTDAATEVPEEREPVTPELRNKVLLLISGLIRHNDLATEAFVQRRGVEVLLHVVTAPHDAPGVSLQVRRKALSLLLYFWREGKMLALPRSDEEEVIRALAQMVNDEDLDLRELSLESLSRFLILKSARKTARERANLPAIFADRTAYLDAAYHADPEDAAMHDSEREWLRDCMSLLAKDDGAAPVAAK